MTRTARLHLRLMVSSRHPAPYSRGDTLPERLLDFAGAGPGLRVVEFGFGPGRLARRLVAMGCEAASVDLAATPPFAALGQRPQAFDLAIVTCALHQVPDPERLLAEVAACVRPGGACAGLEPSHQDFGSLDLHGCVAVAGLSLFQTEHQAPSPAVFWRAAVPDLQAVPPPAFTMAA